MDENITGNMNVIFHIVGLFVTFLKIRLKVLDGMNIGAVVRHRRATDIGSWNGVRNSHIRKATDFQDTLDIKVGRIDISNEVNSDLLVVSVLRVRI